MEGRLVSVVVPREKDNWGSVAESQMRFDGHKVAQALHWVSRIAPRSIPSRWNLEPKFSRKAPVWTESNGRECAQRQSVNEVHWC
jgi:hypothetical protein